MAKTKISEFSATPANNTDIDGININEGCAPSGINDAIRELMAQLKDFQTGAVGDSFNGPIGTSTAAAGAFTTLTASSTLNVTGVATLGNGAILGTPASGTVTNLTGTASININGTVGATTPTTGAFTTLAASGAVTLSGGTANGVAYLNGSKVVTSGSALWFDGTNFGVGTGGNTLNHQSVIYKGGANAVYQQIANGSTGLASTNGIRVGLSSAGVGEWYSPTAAISYINNSEQMRLTSTGLGIGTSSPAVKLDVAGTSNGATLELLRLNNAGSGASTAGQIVFRAAGTNYADIIGGYGSASARLSFNVAAGGYQSFAIGGSDKLTLDSSGNLGLGVAPSAWSGYQALQIGSAGGLSMFGYSNAAEFGNNYYYNAGYKYGATASSTNYVQTAGQHRWFNAPSGTAGNAITFTQAMTLDSSGRLGIGTTSPISGSGLTIGDDSSGSVTVKLAFSTSASERGSVSMNGSTGEMRLTSGYSGYGGLMAFYTNGSERARIDSSGNLLVGTTSTYGGPGRINVGFNQSSNFGITLRNTSATATGVFVSFENSSGGGNGSISQTNSTTIAYNTSSDRRLKTNIVSASDAGSDIDAINVVSHGWVSNDDTVKYGVIAQELFNVAPQAVRKGDDGAEVTETWGVDYSKLVPMLVKEIQSLRQRLSAAGL